MSALLLSTPGWKLIATWWAVGAVGQALTAAVQAAALPLAVMLGCVWLLYPVWLTFLEPDRTLRMVACVCAAVVSGVLASRPVFGFMMWGEIAAIVAILALAGAAAAALRASEARVGTWKPFDSFRAAFGLLVWPLFGGLVHERLRTAHSRAAA